MKRLSFLVAASMIALDGDNGFKAQFRKGDTPEGGESNLPQPGSTSTDQGASPEQDEVNQANNQIAATQPQAPVTGFESAFGTGKQPEQ